MGREPDHYESADLLLGLADQAAGRSLDATDANHALVALASGALHLLAAQVHATLAVADALRAGRDQP